MQNVDDFNPFSLRWCSESFGRGQADIQCKERSSGKHIQPTWQPLTLDCAYRLSSKWSYYSEECKCLKSLFSRLKYPQHLINSTSNTFFSSKVDDPQLSQASAEMTSCDVTRVVIPFKEQDSANFVKTKLKDVSLKLHTTIQPVFVSKKIGQDLHERETKPQVVNQQWALYHFQCNLCAIGTYVGYTRGHILHAWMATKVKHLPCANNTIKTTRVPSLRTFSAALVRCFTSNN